ncbi:MAG: polysaccharide biosynthesis C-terminal domain-containing protein [Flavobacteriales bacterium]
MLKQITGTIMARVITTVIGLLVSMIAGHRLGITGLGTIGLIVLGITLIRIGTDLIGGSALVYLVPRVRLRRLLVPGYMWAVVTASVGYGIVSFFGLVPKGYAGHVALLALMQGIYGIHLNVLIGQQRIRVYNQIGVVQSILLIAVFGFLCRSEQATPMAYVTASYFAFGSVVILSTLALRRQQPVNDDGRTDVLRLLLRQGAYVQGANATQLLNYRLAYWLIEKFKGTAALGIYTVANQLAEGAWLVPKSLAVVLYSKVSNTEGAEGQRLLTLTFLKMSMACATAVVLVLLLLPSVVFQWAFGPEVVGITLLITLLVPGILSMAASQAFSHYFSGTAQNKHNVIGSGLGLVATVVAGVLLIPAYGLPGAAFSASLAYGINAVYQAITFMRLTSSTFKDLWPNAPDIERMRELLARLKRG